MFRILVVLVCLGVSLAAAAEPAPLPSPTKGSCTESLPAEKKPDGTPDLAFTGASVCLDFLGEKMTLNIVTNACKSGKAAATPCATNNVLFSCRKDTKAGPIIERWYAAPDATDEVSRKYNAKIAGKGCKPPATLFVAEAVATVAAPAPVAAVSVPTAPGVKPLPAPSHGSCTAPMPAELKFPGAQNCFEFPGDKVDLAGIKEMCGAPSTPAGAMCPVTNVAISCTRDSPHGQVIERWYRAPGADKDATAKTYNERLLVKACVGKWTVY